MVKISKNKEYKQQEESQLERVQLKLHTFDSFLQIGIVVSVIFIIRVKTVIFVAIYFPNVGFLVHRVQEG